ncbi:MAG: hypothetical protein ACRD1U_13390, partial [Vicinamibacterales bacterium]
RLPDCARQREDRRPQTDNSGEEDTVGRRNPSGMRFGSRELCRKKEVKLDAEKGSDQEKDGPENERAATDPPAGKPEHFNGGDVTSRGPVFHVVELRGNVPECFRLRTA